MEPLWPAGLRFLSFLLFFKFKKKNFYIISNPKMTADSIPQIWGEDGFTPLASPFPLSGERVWISWDGFLAVCSRNEPCNALP